MIYAKLPFHRLGSASFADRAVAEEADSNGLGAFRLGLLVHKHGLGHIPATAQCRTLNEPTRKLP